MDSQQHTAKEQLKRGLKNRHIRLIALGGAIGQGLFWEAPPLFSRRGGELSGYAITGLYCLSDYTPAGEMVVERTGRRLFSHFAYKCRGGFAGIRFRLELLECCT